MDIKFYIPKDESIPTRLRLKVDGADVYYERVDSCFAYDFTLCGKAKENATAIVDEIVRKMCNQSYDHGAMWRETNREVIEEAALDWECTIIRVHFRVRDAG